MAVEKVPDPYDLIQENFPTDSEEKFAASAASMGELVLHHNLMSSEYTSAIAGLGDEHFQGMLADATREEFSKLSKSHDAGEQFCQKLAETFASLGMQILTCKNNINSECSMATAKIGVWENLKVLANPEAQKEYQKKIDDTKTQTREDIASLNDQLEKSMTDAETSLGALHEQFLAETADTGGAGKANAAMGERSTPTPDSAMASRSDFPGADALGSEGGLAEGSANSSGAEQLSNAASPMNPGALMGGMPQQMPAPAAGAPSGGGGMGSQLPGQELASKAMDMAQNLGGKESTFLSDDSVKDLLAASSANVGGNGGGDSSLSDSSQGGSNGSGGAGGGAVGAVPVSNPSVASGPSPAAPVSSPRPAGGPSVAMTELAGAPTAGGVVNGLGSAASGVSGLAGSPAAAVPAVAQPISTAAGNVGGAGYGAPLAFSPNAGSVVVPSTPGVVGSVPVSGGPVAPGSPAPVPPSGGQVGPGAVPAAPAPVPGSAPAPVGAPPVVAGIAAVPASLGSVPAGVLNLLGPPAMLAVSAAAPDRLVQLPVEQRITILNTASIVTQMREIGWPASVATALLDDGVAVAVAIATGDDLSIMPADITIPRASILLHNFNLGERFRSEWAGNADTVAKLVAGIDRHPWLNRSMIKHVCAFTRNREIADPAVPFTPLSMDAAWAIRYLYTPPRETVPAYTLQAETFTEDQIRYLLGVAERHWRLPTIRLRREGQARLESASMFASRWSDAGEAVLQSSPRGYDQRIAGFLYSSVREALLAGDLDRASWYAQYLWHQTLPSARSAAAA